MIVFIFRPAAYTCGRCRKEISSEDAETCWFCMGDLCRECWEEHGHCGHEDADRLNRASRMLDAEGRRFLLQTFLNGGGN